MIDNRVLLMGRGIDAMKVWENGGKLADEWLAEQKNAEMANIKRQTQDITDPDSRFNQMIGLAKQSKRSPWLIADLEAEKSAAAQAEIANREKMANINETISKANKNNADASQTVQKTGQARIGSLKAPAQALLMTGNIDFALDELDTQYKAGAIDDDTYESYRTRLQTMKSTPNLKPEEIMNIGNAMFKGILPPEYSVQTANNMADNQTKFDIAKMDNETKFGIAQMNDGTERAIAQAKIEQDDRHHQDNISFKQAELALQSQQGNVVEAGGVLWFVDKLGNHRMMTNDYGQPLTSKEANSLRQAKEENKARMEKLDLTIAEAKKLINQSTGSGIGAGVDWVARQFGFSTDGGEAIKQLQVLAGALVAEMPKMSGPQSDKDVELYKQMAADVANPTIPVNERLKALEMLENLNKKYAGHAGVTLPSQKQQQNQPVKMVNNPYQQHIDSAGSKYGIE